MAEISRQLSAVRRIRALYRRIGAIAYHRHDRGFQAMVEFRADSDRLAVVGLDRHIVQPTGAGAGVALGTI